MQKAGLTLASGSLVGVGCKLEQFVVFCVLLAMMSINIEKKLGCFRGGAYLNRAYGFYLVVSLASMQYEIPFPK